MDLVRDLLDKAVVDRNGREIGRVDAIVIELRDDASPRVAAIELGAAVLAARIHPWLGRLMAGIERVAGIDRERPIRIPFSDILSIGDVVKVDRTQAEARHAA